MTKIIYHKNLNMLKCYLTCYLILSNKITTLWSAITNFLKDAHSNLFFGPKVTLSPQVKKSVIISNTLVHMSNLTSMPNDLRLMILGDIKIS